MEVSLTGTLVENTFESELKASSHFPELLGYGGKHNRKILLFLSFYDVQDLSDAQCVMCLPWLQVPGSLQLFWAQDKQHDYIDEWISKRLP